MQDTYPATPVRVLYLKPSLPLTSDAVLTLNTKPLFQSPITPSPVSATDTARRQAVLLLSSFCNRKSYNSSMTVHATLKSSPSSCAHLFISLMLAADITKFAWQ